MRQQIDAANNIGFWRKKLNVSDFKPYRSGGYKPAALSDREQKILLALLDRGMPVSELADLFGLSKMTIHNYRKRLTGDR